MAVILDKHFILGFLLIITGIFDSIKYLWESSKIKSIKTARGHSRKFVNASLINAVMRLIYSISISDIYFTIISILSLYCILHFWITIYLYYPYRNRNKPNFKRPSLIIYIINSLLPNSLRKRL